MLEDELMRMAAVLPSLGAHGTLLVNDFLSSERIAADAELELLVIQETPEPFRRRADFFVSHLRPIVATQFYVYTPQEYEAFRDTDRIIRRALHHGQVIDEPV